ncbi:MAG TPA: hypothetical protein VN032_11190 [Thermoanaerobaculia bacterium]|nr:hypothetical protein [Thermoanaerobaculia bacterium]
MSKGCLSSRVRSRVGIAVVAVLISTVVTAGVGVWTTNGPPGGPAYTVVADPGIAGVVYTVGARSIDNGLTWQANGLASYSPNAVAAGTAGKVYVAGILGTSAVVLGSEDAGVSWTIRSTIPNAGTMPVSGISVDSLVADPLNAATIYAQFRQTYSSGLGNDRVTLERSPDGGRTWGIAGLSLGPTSAVAALAVNPFNTAVLLAWVVDSFYPGGNYRSIDSGVSWSPVSGLSSPSSPVFDPHTPNTAYAVNATTGISKSIDGGATFAPMASNLTNASTLLISPTQSGHFFALADGGVLASSDGGATWTPINEGLLSQGPRDLAIDSTGGFLHAGTSTGVFDYQIAISICTTDAHTLCLNNGRFSVTATFQQTPEGPSSPATAVPLTADTGYFWFFDSANVEMVVKVLTGCSVNNEYWVFAGGLTDVGVQMTVTDTVTGAVKMYSNAFGTPFQPIQDSSAFPCP